MRNERVGKGPAGATAEEHPAAQATHRAKGLPTGASAEPHPVACAPEREGFDRASARIKARAHLDKRQRPALSGDAVTAGELATRDDLARWAARVDLTVGRRAFQPAAVSARKMRRSARLTAPSSGRRAAPLF